ncbi:MAG: hypothetical protein ABWZ90_09515 [Acidimicrobiales bacterium]
MIIRADLEAGSVTLLDPADFRGFHVAVVGGDVTDERLELVLAPYGRLDGDHAWIKVDAVAALAGENANDHWRAGLDGMIAFARDNDFLDDSGSAIRAHLRAD